MTRVIGILALLSAVVASWACAGGTATTRSSCVRSHPVRFRAADGTRLAGARYGRGTTAVVLAHQSNGNVCQWAFYARRLASLGYLAFPFDFRGHGESQFRHYPASRRIAAGSRLQRRGTDLRMPSGVSSKRACGKRLMVPTACPS